MALERVPDLDSLQLLLRVAATGSLGRAAAEHGISQPAVSARIRTVEHLVGVPLVTRGPRGSTLTAAGKLVAGWAEQVLAAAAVLDAGASSLREEGRTRLRVAASMTVAEHLLPGWLVALAQRRPETQVSLRAMNSEEVTAAVLAGGADLGFVEGPAVPSGLDSREVARDRLVVVVHPGHPWARRGSPVTAEELARTRLVQREPASGTRSAYEAALRAALESSAGTSDAADGTTDNAPAPPLLELSTSSAIRSAVASGAGPAVLSEHAVRDDLAAGRLTAVAVTGLDLTRALRAVWPTGQRPSGPSLDLLSLAARDVRH
ncbi:DNA-binding transcriptional regulator, LysR family [Quadrisphaera granulorum]|uniref:DNA-binding transcriptional LysR family regulator n=1 Tax=Quadrisphaera granulorum TaxID=317664 RepID=A0A316A9E8_9ACTN|nr:LysR family transcriptional regulator [Quadrisphaera granulorum]PWJ54311.1 DNA-binding transcriptional LysR family regulator [Quadrisphaera granulorum]SZE96083.1 DNA-binding transcriptional regulator, LysR family [Quadrisphaera granulorum]